MAPKVFILDPTVWLDGAIPANSCIPPSFPWIRLPGNKYLFGIGGHYLACLIQGKEGRIQVAYVRHYCTRHSDQIHSNATLAVMRQCDQIYNNATLGLIFITMRHRLPWLATIPPSVHYKSIKFYNAGPKTFFMWLFWYILVFQEMPQLFSFLVQLLRLLRRMFAWIMKFWVCLPYWQQILIIFT